MWCQMLCLLLLCLSHQAHSTSVHEVSITVRSVKSIVYRGMQVSIFEHAHMPKRYFFQPLSFLNVSSARLTENDLESNRTQLNFDVLLWTDEFIQLVESHFTDNKNIEMLPLTAFSLTWSKQAHMWLGDDYKKTYNLFDDWRDGDKPPMKSTFTIFCNRRGDCKKLLENFNQSEDFVTHLFDLRYKIQSDNSRNFSLTIRGSHFSKSAAFQQIEKFSLKPPGLRHVFVLEQTVDKIADEVYAEALNDLEQKTKQQISTFVNGESRRAVLTRLLNNLRSHPIDLSRPDQLESRVSWPHECRNHCPDRILSIINILFNRSDPNYVRLPDLPLVDKLYEMLPHAEVKSIKAFVQHHKHDSNKVGVKEVEKLALLSDNDIVWNFTQAIFVLSPALKIFDIDVQKLRKSGILADSDLVVDFKVSEHIDQVHPLPKDTQFQNSQWQRHFADSFCILANQVEPPGMTCRVLSYLLPTKSLQMENPEGAKQPRVAFKGGHIGQSHFYQDTSGQFSFSLKICCTKELLRSP